MTSLVRDVMTPDPACCSPATTLDEVARLMLANGCGEIPILDTAGAPVGVVTDRDIVCRVVAEGKNPTAYTAETCMSHPVVTVRDTDTIATAVSAMQTHQIRRVPVVDAHGSCVGIVAQADIARHASPGRTADLVREISREAEESQAH
jgi:CBS domain-containing protein